MTVAPTADLHECVESYTACVESRMKRVEARLVEREADREAGLPVPKDGEIAAQEAVSRQTVISAKRRLGDKGVKGFTPSPPPKPWGNPTPAEPMLPPAEAEPVPLDADADAELSDDEKAVVAAFLADDVLAVVAAWEALPEQKQMAVFSHLGVVSETRFARASREFSARGFALQWQRDWLEAHFNVAVEWPEMRTKWGGCGGNNCTIATVGGAPVVRAREAA